MDLPKFSVKADILAQHYVTVKLNKFGDKKTSNYNGKETITYWGNCHVDGIEHMWFMTENMRKGIIEGGFGEGDTFCVQKWKEGDKMGYNYLACDDIQITNSKPMKKEQVLEQTTETTGEPQTITSSPMSKPVDDVQERILKGMCFNGACRLFSQTGNGNGDTIKTEVILNTSKALYKEMKEWLTT